ncbi:MAG: hypothetical protein M1371_04725 [Actinobacteria bacterium]|nr:hypothetical protein [Actinomycetota bacterium]
MYQVIVPLLTFVISFGFAIVVIINFYKKRKKQDLFWALGLLAFSLGALSEATVWFFGFNIVIFKIWYLCGAILTAAFLGQGSLYLVIKNRIIDALSIVLVIASVLAGFRVFLAQIDLSLLTYPILSGNAIVSSWVRGFTPFFNVYGTLGLLGVAIYTLIKFIRSRKDLRLAIGSILIAIGAIIPATGGSLNRAGMPLYSYYFELLGVLFILAGYLTQKSVSVSKRL